MYSWISFSSFNFFQSALYELAVQFCSAAIEFLVVSNLLSAAIEPRLNVRVFIQGFVVDGLS